MSESRGAGCWRMQRARRESAAARGDAAKSFAPFLISLFRSKQERALAARSLTSGTSLAVRSCCGCCGAHGHSRSRETAPTFRQLIAWDRAATLFSAIIFAFNTTQIAMTTAPAACGFLCLTLNMGTECYSLLSSKNKMRHLF